MNCRPLTIFCTNLVLAWLLLSIAYSTCYAQSGTSRKSGQLKSTSTPASQPVSVEVIKMPPPEDSFMKIWGPSMIGRIVSVIALIAIPLILRKLDKRAELKKEQDRYALELYKTWMGSEFYVKARLTAQEYLLPPGEKYKQFVGTNFDQINEKLMMSSEPDDREARICIRAITNFFYMVNQAMKSGLISQKTSIFAETYAWYWLHIICLHVDNMTSRSDQFLVYNWMTKKREIEKLVKEREWRLQGSDYSSVVQKDKGTEHWN